MKYLKLLIYEIIYTFLNFKSRTNKLALFKLPRLIFRNFIIKSFYCEGAIRFQW